MPLAHMDALASSIAMGGHGMGYSQYSPSRPGPSGLTSPIGFPGLNEAAGAQAMWSRLWQDASRVVADREANLDLVNVSQSQCCNLSEGQHVNVCKSKFASQSSSCIVNCRSYMSKMHCQVSKN